MNWYRYNYLIPLYNVYIYILYFNQFKNTFSKINLLLPYYKENLY